MRKSVLSYPGDDEDLYLSWYKDSFSSVFVATNTFLKVPNFPLNNPGNWVPDEVVELAKHQGEETGVSWQEIADLCDFPSIAHVNRALRMTGSRRIDEEFACYSDTEKMLKMCGEQNIFYS